MHQANDSTYRCDRPIDAATHSLTRPLTLTHSLTRSLTHSLTHSSSLQALNLVDGIVNAENLQLVCNQLAENMTSAPAGAYRDTLGYKIVQVGSSSSSSTNQTLLPR